MNWDAIGAVAEALGAAGVIASLLYLAIQVRASTRASAVEAKLQSTRLLSETMDVVLHSPELAAIHSRGLADLESLSKEEYYRFSILQGHGRMRIGSEDRAVGQGSILYVPRATVHAFRNLSDAPAAAYAAYAPAFDGQDRQLEE